MNQKNLSKLIDESISIETEEAKKINALGYMARSLVQATMPHKNPGTVEAWGRRNGNFSMVIQPGYEIDKNNKTRCVGLPYGPKPRLIMAFISSEAVRTKSREIVFGKNLSEFMRSLHLIPTGGKNGAIRMLKEQMKRLFLSTVSFKYEGDNSEINGGFRIASKVITFWDPKSQKESKCWESVVTLSQEFYDEVTKRPVPFDVRAMTALKNSSLAMDIYFWITYRMSYLKAPVEIPWQLLAMQFGSDYEDIRDFKKNFIKQLRKVSVVYKFKAESNEKGLFLKPEKPHIPKSKLC